jgi:hypothetical protein
MGQMEQLRRSLERTKRWRRGIAQILTDADWFGDSWSDKPAPCSAEEVAEAMAFVTFVIVERSSWGELDLSLFGEDELIRFMVSFVATLDQRIATMEDVLAGRLPLSTRIPLD